MNVRRKKFIEQMIKTGDHVKSYMVAYSCTDRKKAATLGGRLMKKVEIVEYINKKSKKIVEMAEKEAIQELKEEIKVSILSVLEKRELLFKIAIGEYENEIKKPVYNPISKSFQTITVIEKPDSYERMKAIEIDNKMAGDDSVTVDYKNKLYEITKERDKLLKENITLTQEITGVGGKVTEIVIDPDILKQRNHNSDRWSDKNIEE